MKVVLVAIILIAVISLTTIIGLIASNDHSDHELAENIASTTIGALIGFIGGIMLKYK